MWGTFDVTHVGHIRWASFGVTHSVGPILVHSLPCDGGYVGASLAFMRSCLYLLIVFPDFRQSEKDAPRALDGKQFEVFMPALRRQESLKLQ